MQNTEAARRVALLLTDLSLDDTVPRLTNKTYVGINATTRSLESLPNSVVELKDTPAFRISAVCRPDLPYSIDIRAWNVYNTRISLAFNQTDSSREVTLTANYPGVPADVRLTDADDYSFLAFSMSYKEAYLGHLQRWAPSNYSTVLSDFGIVYNNAVNLTMHNYGDLVTTKMSASGIRCLLNREHGLANATRTANNKSNTET